MQAIEIYNEAGQLVSKTSYLKDSNHVCSIQSCYYNKNGKKTEEHVEANKGEFISVDDRTIYQYDSNKLIGSKQINSHNICYSVMLYKYDDIGRKVEETQFEDSGAIIYSHVVYSYSLNNKIIEAKEYRNMYEGKKRADDNVLKYLGTAINTYDDSGKLLQKKKVGFTDEFHETFIIKMGDCTDSIGAKIVIRTSYKYNSLGRLIEEVQYDKENVAISTEMYSYQDFDQEGNWCKQTEYWTLHTSTCKTQVRVTDRRIEYY